MLCDGESAEQIRNALTKLWPDFQWFVFIQDERQGWAAEYDNSSIFHRADNLCGKDLVVWLLPVGVDGCSEHVAGAAAQKLIDTAVEIYGNNDENVRDYILSSM